MPSTQLAPKLLNASDDFIGEILPAWLKGASANQLKALRSRFVEHRDSQQALRTKLDLLQHPTQFAKDLLGPALKTLLAQTVDLDRAQWRERKLKFDASLSRTEFVTDHSSALPRLMQNFKDGESFFNGTALVYPAGQAAEQVLSAQTDALVALCRRVDVGGAYQKHLNDVLDKSFMAQLAKDRRLQLALTTQIAALKGQLGTDDASMLQRVTQQQAVSHRLSATVRCGELKTLDARVDGALAFELRGAWEFEGQPSNLPITPLKGVILYLPGDSDRPLRHYANWRAASLALGERLRSASYRQAFVQRIALADRAAWLTTLGKRLEDPDTDLQASFAQVSGDLFEAAAAQHLQRIRDDAQVLMVPTATVNAGVAQARLKALETAGLVLLNLAGLFVPGVGEVLLADMIRQTLMQVFEGVDDWSQGHRHEALEHLLGVAETVAVAGATVGAASFVRSTFVEGLVPVIDNDGASRLWSEDLTPYVRSAPPAGCVELDSGLLRDGQDHWWQDAEGRYFQVRPSDGQSTWQLVHPVDGSAYAPQLEYNGERLWRLTSEHPLEWQGQRQLLSRLWPPARQLDEQRIAAILKVAGVDEVQLRGLLVENRQLPVALRDTLERFAVDARLQTFFEQLAEGQVNDTDAFERCVAALGLDGEAVEAQTAAVLAEQALLRARLLDQLALGYLRTDAQLALLQRDFPGLPNAYGLRLLEQVTADQRERMISESRIPLAVAEQVRAVVRLAQLTRMRESLYLSGSHSELTSELVFAMLRRRPEVPTSFNLVAREGGDTGRTLARLYPESREQASTITVWRDGRFYLYDPQGRVSDIELAEPAGLAQVLAACLPEAALQRLGWQGADASERILADLRTWLPEEDQALTRLLGLREQRPWHVPLQRLADGRLGYLLNGRRGSPTLSHTVLCSRVRTLYPGFNDREVNTFVNILLESPGSAYASIQTHERAYRQLDETLHSWVSAERAVAQQNLRRLVADELRRSWRLQGEPVQGEPGDPEGRRLSLIGIPVGGLPELPAGADFSHVTELTLVGLRLERLSPNFLSSFPELRRLNLSNNQLRAIPEGIGRLTHLRVLDLARNRIRINSAGVRALRNLAIMRNLDLSNNALGSVSLDFRQMSRLREINLSRTSLQAMPQGLEWCAFLDYADLRDNQIASIPPALLDAPYALRQSLDFSGNPLPASVRQRLYAPGPVPLQVASGGQPAGASASASASARALWLATLEPEQQAQRGEQWDALRAEPGSDGLFQLLFELTESSDYRQTRGDLARRVWEVIDAAVRDSALREELFNLAGSERTCVDSVASCFSTLQVRALVAHTLRDVDPERAVSVRLDLARRLYRLDQVEQIARADITRRRAASEEVDEVEVSLAYRTGLAGPLNLPGQPQTMQFQSIADVSQAQLDAAAREVRSRERGAGLAEYISERDFWLTYLRGEHAERFTAVEQPFWDQLEALRPDQQPESQYVAATNQLASDRKKALQQLALRLTREALAAQASNAH